MRFAEALCSRHADGVAACAAHPALAAIARDAMPRRTFMTYLEQNIYFLAQEARVFALAASRMPSIAALSWTAEQVRTVKSMEHARYVRLREHLGESSDPGAIEPIPAMYGYAAHLRSIALEGTSLEILTALLAAAHVCWYFVHTVAGPGPRDPVYAIWFNTFQSDDYAAWLDTHADLIDRAAEHVDPAAQQRAERAFAVSLHYFYIANDGVQNGDTWLRSRAG